MGERDIIVIFDPFVLERAVSQDPYTAEYEALEVLIKNCPNRLVINDAEGRLGRAYVEALAGRFGLVQSLLLERIPGEAKLAEPSRRFPVAGLGNPSRLHIRFLRAALGIRPNYLITEIRRLPTRAAAIRDAFGTELLSPQQYINLF